MRYGYILFIAMLEIILLGCGGALSGGGDSPVAVNNSANSTNSVEVSASMYEEVTPLGIKIQSNGFRYDLKQIDQAFFDTEKCLGYSNIPADIYLILKKPYSAFPCVPLPGGCGGLFDLDNGEPVITVTADMIRLKHEYIHYMMYIVEGTSDPGHTSPAFKTCV